MKNIPYDNLLFFYMLHQYDHIYSLSHKHPDQLQQSNLDYNI